MLPDEPDAPVPLDPEPETPALLEVPPRGEVLLPELVVPELDAPPPDGRSLDIVPDVLPVPLDTDPLADPLPADERPPGAALGLDPACASRLH